MGVSYWSPIDGFGALVSVFQARNQLFSYLSLPGTSLQRSKLVRIPMSRPAALPYAILFTPLPSKEGEWGNKDRQAGRSIVTYQ
jgi:hypothetical protein